MNYSSHRDKRILLLAVFITASCGILYELLIGTLSGYLQGSSILQFSLTIGFFMFFMGVGSFISKYIKAPLLIVFIQIQLWLALIGGFSATILYAAFAFLDNYYLVAFLIVAALGTLIGLEIPLIARLSQPISGFKDAVADVFSIDYIGALAASLLFPLVLLPFVGVMRTSFLIGLLNVGVAVLCLLYFKHTIKDWLAWIILSSVVGIGLGIGFLYSFKITHFYETYLYKDEIILSQQSPYQRLIVTRWHDDIRLYLNGGLQFSSVDEARYHEPLAHIPLSIAPHKENVLILGGGDGLLAREVLKYKDIQQIDLVDLDPKMTSIAAHHPVFTRLNQHSLTHPKLKIHHTDAFAFVRDNAKQYSVIIIDLPDPKGVEVGKLYTKEFYELTAHHLAADGVMITQATSPYFARNAFWCIKHTVAEVFPYTYPYTTYVPSFGQWGYVLATKRNILERDSVNSVLSTYLFRDTAVAKTYRYLNPSTIPTLSAFPEDMTEIPTSINTLETQSLIQYYEKSAENWE